MSDAVNCEYCVNYSYDDDYECYTCEVNLDEDEMVKFITGKSFIYQCPYFKMGDEYRIVRKQDVKYSFYKMPSGIIIGENSYNV